MSFRAGEVLGTGTLEARVGWNVPLEFIKRISERSFYLGKRRSSEEP